MVKAIIFDFYGVLFSRGVWDLFTEAGGDLDKDGEFLDNILDQLNTQKLDPYEYNKQVALKLGISVGYWLELNEAVRIVNEKLFKFIEQKLKHKYKLAILSNAPSGFVEVHLNERQLNLFDAKVVSGDVNMAKPNPEIFKLVANELGVDTQDCVFTDDHGPYLVGAESVGMKTILFKNTDQFKADLQKIL
jgi:putative hydrolase of the HAD superfamily